MSNSFAHVAEMRYLMEEIRIMEDFLQSGCSSSDVRTMEIQEMQLRTYLMVGVPIQDFRDKLAELQKIHEERALARLKAREEETPTTSSPPASQPTSCPQDPGK